ncbi:MAG TPA: hypothetical protein VIE89_19335 [Candidatus Binatia bacterium]
MNAGSADRSAARLNEFLKNIASVMRRRNRLTLKSELIVAYIPIRDPLAKNHPQLRQATVRLLALAGSHGPGRLRSRPRGKAGPPRPSGHVGDPQRPAHPARAPAGSHVPADELH